MAFYQLILFFAQKDQIEILAFNGAKTISLCSICSNALVLINLKVVDLSKLETFEIGNGASFLDLKSLRPNVVAPKYFLIMTTFHSICLSIGVDLIIILDQIFSSVFVS